MIDTKTFKEISDLINLKQLCGVSKPEQINNGKSPNSIDLTSISVTRLNNALKKLNENYKINLKKYQKALDTQFMISYISGYIKQVIKKMIENNKISDLTFDEIKTSFKNQLKHLEETINTIDEKRNEYNKLRAETVKEYKKVAEEYEMMVKVLKRIKPDIKGEDFINKELFFSDSSIEVVVKKDEKFTSTGLLKSLFDQFPDEMYEATKLRDVVQWAEDRKILKNKSDNLQGSTHSSIKVLLKQKYIERIEQDGKTYYKKRQP
ncbi:MAG: hypothetical protein A2V93_03905 [Ignavibacteria bacterium RBG_16_34_14]|nr:MAG: hypothetical protein A2V93_03905 [Ignavibacteria bacterium RBG_16_34_14]